MTDISRNLCACGDEIFYPLATRHQCGKCADHDDEMAKGKAMAEFALDEQYEKTTIESQILTHENLLMAMKIDQLEAFIYEADLTLKFENWKGGIK